MIEKSSKDDLYAELMQKMQAGVKVDLASDPDSRKPGDMAKHLRVGVNSAMMETGALTALLIQKGIVTEAEWFDTLVVFAESEVRRYENLLSERFGRQVVLELPPGWKPNI